MLVRACVDELEKGVGRKKTTHAVTTEDNFRSSSPNSVGYLFVDGQSGKPVSKAFYRFSLHGGLR